MRASMISLSLCLLLVRAQVVTRIIQDSDPSVDYEPSKFWRSSTVACSDCPPINPTLTLGGNGTFHNGTYILAIFDPDDLPGSPSRVRRFMRHRRSSKDGGDHGGNDGGDKSSSSSQQQSDTSPSPTSHGETQSQSSTPTIPTSGPLFTDGPDSDDPNFIPETVSVTFRFTGQSAQLWAIIPTFIIPNMISTTNVSFLIDGQKSAPDFLFNPTAPGMQFKSQAILQIGALPDAEHTIVAIIAPNSVLLLDYLLYTALASDPLPSAGVAATSTLTASTNTLTGASEAPVTKHNVATFAGAVGGSVGVLSVLAVCLWVSIWRRRRASHRRLLALQEEEAANARALGLDPAINGPIPFIPRFFPGTTPPSPPPYEPSDELEGATASCGSSMRSVNGGVGTGGLSAMPRRTRRVPAAIPQPETSQLHSTPPVSIAAASILNRSAPVSIDRPSSILSLDQVSLGPPPTIGEDEGQHPPPLLPIGYTTGPPGLVAPVARRVTPPPSLLEEKDEPERPPSRTPRPLSAPREDETSDTETGRLMRSGSVSSDLLPEVPYRDDPARIVHR